MTRPSREKRLDALGSTADRDAEEYPIPDGWVEHVPPWLRGDHDDAFMFLLKASYGDFDTDRGREWYDENAPEDFPDPPNANEAAREITGVDPTTGEPVIEDTPETPKAHEAMGRDSDGEPDRDNADIS